MGTNLDENMLSDAFNLFKDASTKLEQQYSLLERKIEDLNEELAEKNSAMERTRRLAAMGEMAAKIAHEIRNPLGSMAIFATLLERELGADDEKKKLAGHITKGVKTLDNLLSNMLLFASAPGARKKSVDIREVIEESLSSTRGHEKPGVRIKAESAGRTEIMADRHQLRQLFLNLFLNSLDSLDEGGLLYIKTRVSKKSNPGYLEIEISDTGSGIPEEYLDRIFDPFFSTKERGTGLGLAIVAAVVHAHDGFIDVSSEPGRGTTFVISLPVAGPEEKAPC
ncbi:MAG: ATP-binding protein [Deltaproteobacteria bacterium]|nr:ATP-binding protein [Deltaproteobacteria bacterium]